MWDIAHSPAGRPLYIALVESLEKAVEDGDVLPGDRLPTHRELAKKMGVTVTTVTRAYAEAEKRCLVTGVVGKGTFVAGGAPVPPSQAGNQDVFPIEMGVASPMYREEPDITPVVERVMKKNDMTTLTRFHSPQGLPEHREVGAGWISRTGIKASSDTVLISAGPQHSMVSVFHAVFEAGDRIAVEQLTSPVFKSYARRTGLVLEGIPLDSEGMIPEKLEEACKSGTIRGLYTSGNLQLPGYEEISAKRRRALARIIKQYDLILVEDDSFNFLNTRKNHTLSSLAPQNSIYIASASAAFYAGLRIAFIHAPSRYYSRISQGIADTIWMVSPLCAAIACECIASGLGDRIIRNKSKELAKRTHLFKQKLQEYETSCSTNSMFAWLKLPEYWTSSGFEHAAEKSGVRVFAAEKFAVGPAAPPNCIRLVMTGPPDFPTFKKGIDILLTVLKRESGYVNLLL